MWDSLAKATSAWLFRWRFHFKLAWQDLSGLSSIKSNHFLYVRPFGLAFKSNWRLETQGGDRRRGRKNPNFPDLHSGERRRRKRPTDPALYVGYGRGSNPGPWISSYRKDRGGKETTDRERRCFSPSMQYRSVHSFLADCHLGLLLPMIIPSFSLFPPFSQSGKTQGFSFPNPPSNSEREKSLFLSFFRVFPEGSKGRLQRTYNTVVQLLEIWHALSNLISTACS